MSGQIVFGQALFEAGEWVEAREVFERALTLDPENLIALRSLGDMTLQAGDTAAARTWYTRLLDADPKDAAVIALISEIDSSSVAAAAPVAEEIPASDPALDDQQITYIENAPEPAVQADSAPVEIEALSSPAPAEASEAEAGSAEAPEGLERHYPVETEEPALEASDFVETENAVADIKSEKEDVGNALDAPRMEAEAAPAEPPSAPEPFVNETMAQLYLQQGYRQLAINVYRQLSASRPNDQALKDRIAELESADAAEHPGEAPVMRREEPSIERPSEPAAPRSPSIEAPTPWTQPGSEESPGFDRSPIDSPPTGAPSRDRESVESPVREEPRAEPEGIAAREPSIREFFATLGRRRPPRAGGSPGQRSSAPRQSDAGPSLSAPAAGASLDSVFAGATVSPADARAASRLAGAFSGATGGTSRTPLTPAMPTPRVNPRVQQPQESEEDVAKFRAWLDGLTRE
jgi:tetratricopeptide (TPR) repeat protein